MALISFTLGACGGGDSAGAAHEAELSAVAALGEKIFSDKSLSASGGQSCASCHDPAHAHAQANDFSVQMGPPI